jgi:hypothetical protein
MDGNLGAKMVLVHSEILVCSLEGATDEAGLFRGRRVSEAGLRWGWGGGGFRS